MKMKLLSLFHKPIFAALVALGACLLHYQLAAPVYEGEVGLQIAATSPYFDDDSATVSEVTPPEVLSIAMKSLDAQREKAGSALIDIGELSRNLSVSASDTEKTLQLHYAASDQSEVASVLDAVADAYLEFSRELKSSDALPRLATLRRQAESLRKQIGENQRQIEEISQQRQDARFTKSGHAISLAKLEAFSAQITNVKSDRLRAETRYREAAVELESGSAVNLVAAQLPSGPAKEIVQAVMSHADFVEELKQVRAKKRQLLQIYGSKHPRIVEIVARERDLSRQIDVASGSVSAIESATAYVSQDLDRQSLLLRSLELDLRRHQALEEDLQEQLELEQATLNKQDLLQEQSRQAQREGTAFSEQLADVSAKLKQTERRHRALATISQPATISSEPVSPNLPHHLFWGALAALLLAALSHWAFRDLESEEAPEAPSASEKSGDDPQEMPPLHVRRLMRLTKLRQKQVGG